MISILSSTRWIHIYTHHIRVAIHNFTPSIHYHMYINFIQSFSHVKHPTIVVCSLTSLSRTQPVHEIQKLIAKQLWFSSNNVQLFAWKHICHKQPFRESSVQNLRGCPPTIDHITYILGDWLFSHHSMYELTWGEHSLKRFELETFFEMELFMELKLLSPLHRITHL